MKQRKYGKLQTFSLNIAVLLSLVYSGLFELFLAVWLDTKPTETNGNIVTEVLLPRALKSTGLESLPGRYRGGVSSMETDSVTGGDVDSVQGGMVSLDPVVDGILMDSFCQQQGWVRVYGK